MGGVDRADKKAANNVNLHCCIKWWKKAFFDMLEVAVVNAGIIYQVSISPEYAAHVNFDSILFNNC